MDIKAMSTSEYTFQAELSISRGEDPHSVVKLDRALVGQLDIFDVLAAIAAEERDA